MGNRKARKKDTPIFDTGTDLKTLVRRYSNHNHIVPHAQLPADPAAPYQHSSPWTTQEMLHLIINRVVGYTWAAIAHYLQAQRYDKTDLDCMHQARSLFDSGEWLEYVYEWAADDFFPPPPKHMLDGEDPLKHRWYCKILEDVRKMVGPPAVSKRDLSAGELGMPAVETWDEEFRRGAEVLFEFGDLAWPRCDAVPVVGKKKVIR